MSVVVGIVVFAGVCVAAWRVNSRDIGIAEVWVAVLAGVGSYLLARNVLGW